MSRKEQYFIAKNTLNTEEIGSVSVPDPLTVNELYVNNALVAEDITVLDSLTCTSANFVNITAGNQVSGSAGVFNTVQCGSLSTSNNASLGSLNVGSGASLGSLSVSGTTQLGSVNIGNILECKSTNVKGTLQVKDSLNLSPYETTILHTLVQCKTINGTESVVGPLGNFADVQCATLHSSGTATVNALHSNTTINADGGLQALNISVSQSLVGDDATMNTINTNQLNVIGSFQTDYAYINNNLQACANVFINNGQLVIGNYGSLANPSIIFADQSTGTGLYYGFANNDLRLAAGSYNVATFSPLNRAVFLRGVETSALSKFGIAETTELRATKGRIGAGGTMVNMLRYGRTGGGSSGVITVSFGDTFPSTPTVVVSAEKANTEYFFTYSLQTVSTTNFSYTYHFFTKSQPSNLFGAMDGHTMNWVAVS